MRGVTQNPELGPDDRGNRFGRADRPQRADRMAGLLVIAVAFMVSLGIAYWSQRVARGPVSAPPGPPTTEGVVGWPSAVNPVETLAAVRALTQRSLLRGFVMEGVRSNGTINLRDGTGHVRYSFQSPPGKGPPPPDSDGRRPMRWRYCGEQSVNLDQQGLTADLDRSSVLCPPAHVEPLPDPRCALRDIWKQAIARGAPTTAVARVEYYRAQAGPAWRFDIVGTQHRFSIYGDCERPLMGAEAAGSVP
jgi:hypothetical protein